MRKIMLCSLAVGGFASATPAIAGDLTLAEVQSFATTVADYLKSINYTAPGASSADLQTAALMYQNLAVSPSLAPAVNTTNSVLKSSSACGSMGTYPNFNQTSFGNCAQDLAKGLVASGTTSQDAALVAGIGLAKAAGFPLTIPGTTVTVPTSGAGTVAPPVTVTPPPTTTTAQAVTEKIAQVVAPQIQRATSIQQASIISNVVSNIFSARAPNAPRGAVRADLRGARGMAAGDEAPKFNAWINASESKIGSSATGSMFDGKVTNAIGGVDYMVSDSLVAGVGVGHDRVSLDFRFAGLTDSGLVSSGWMLSPYASYQISDIFSVDGAFGHAEGDVDTRTSGVTSTKDYTRDFLALNLNANYWAGDVQLTGKVNYIAANEKVATTNKMEQIRLGGQVGYWLDGIMPYAGIAYVRDLKISTGGIQPANVDKEAWVASIGANLFSKGAIYGGISYTEELGRADSKNRTFMANVGYRF